MPPILEAVICSALGIAPNRIVDDLAHQSIPEWDSLGHVALMLALEAAYGTRIGGGLVSQLTSVRALRAFVLRLEGAEQPPAPSDVSATAIAAGDAPVVQRGLVGVCVDHSTITEVDPAGAALRYRGYDAGELAEHATYEETAFLLLHGRLPEPCELAEFRAALVRRRALPAPIVALVAALVDAPPFVALQAALTGLGAFAGDAPDTLDLGPIAQVPTVLGTLQRLRSGRALLAPRDDLGHAANLLYQLTGRIPGAAEADAFDAALVLLADHGSSASTFTARVVTGTRASLHGALSSAVAAFSGALHGGAIDAVIAMAEEVGSPAAAPAYVRRRLARNEVVYGFGHRVYRTADPRSHRLRAIARRLSEERGDTRVLDVLEAVAHEMTDHRRLGLDVNVDFYASVVFEALGVPRDLFGPAFAAARMAGLIAHVDEQRANNVLIRPHLHYTGAPSRAYRQAVLS